MPALTNPKHEAFAQAVGTGSTPTAAYREAFGCTQKSAESNATRLRNSSSVEARIAEVQAEWKKHREAEAGESLQARFLTLDEKREFLALVVRTAIGLIDENSPLCQRVKRSVSEKGSTVEFTMPDKLRAIELDATLAGELIEKTEITGNWEPLEDLRARLDAARQRHSGE